MVAGAAAVVGVAHVVGQENLQSVASQVGAAHPMLAGMALPCTQTWLSPGLVMLTLYHLHVAGHVVTLNPELVQATNGSAVGGIVIGPQKSPSVNSFPVDQTHFLVSSQEA